MKRFASGVFTLALILGGTSAFAQDAVVEEPTEAESGDRSSEWLFPTVIGVVVLCVLFCDGDDPAPAPTSGMD